MERDFITYINKKSVGLETEEIKFRFFLYQPIRQSSLGPSVGLGMKRQKLNYVHILRSLFIGGVNST